jgi:hypothetical protein
MLLDGLHTKAAQWFLQRLKTANGHLANGRLGKTLRNSFKDSGDHCAPAIFRPKFLGLCSRVSSEVAAFRPLADQSKV